ncbi:MAG: SRPBCC domain-containing protein [Phycisphaerales bacterium]|nr:SRPBCC domain-containing protein [Phycisphaerales bacterium]
MKTRTKLALGLVALLAMGAGGDGKMIGPTGEPQAVDASMFVGGGMDAPGIDINTVVNAPVAEVYKSFTTSAGWKKTMGVETAIELRIGGPWEIYFDPQTKIGSNGCQVLSYVPNEMVSFSWNTPPKFEQERAKRTWVVVTFADAGSGKTTVRLRHLGFTGEGKWPEVKAYFASAWPNVLKALSESFEGK